MEDSATRSDVVYSFAEVKYKQLVPIAPSNEGALAGRGEPTEEDDGLTPDAIVGIAEEALVLYLKALAILTNTINLAGSWWSSKTKARDREAQRADAAVSASPRTSIDGAAGNADGRRRRSSSSTATAARINAVVQWSRNRFNECLEKSEFVSRKMLDAQQKLRSYRASSSASRDDDIRSTGVTAEKLMYERALEMSRAAAVNELTGTDLDGCEVSYITAMRLLEAVLERDDDDDEQNGSKTSQKRQKKAKAETDAEEEENEEDEEVSEEDKETVLKRESYSSFAGVKPLLIYSVIDQMKKRLVDLRKKLAMQKANKQPIATKEKTRPSHQREASSTSPAKHLPEAPRMTKASSSPGQVPRVVRQ